MTLAELEQAAIAGRPWRQRDRQGNEIGCLMPVYLLHPEAPRYVRPPDATEKLRDELRRLLTQEADKPEPGDVVLFSLPYGNRHIGIYLGGGRVVHANATCGLGLIRVPASRIEEVLRWPAAGLFSTGSSSVG